MLVLIVVLLLVLRIAVILTLLLVLRVLLLLLQTLAQFSCAPVLSLTSILVVCIMPGHECCTDAHEDQTVSFKMADHPLVKAPPAGHVLHHEPQLVARLPSGCLLFQDTGQGRPAAAPEHFSSRTMAARSCSHAGVHASRYCGHAERAAAGAGGINRMPAHAIQHIPFGHTSRH